MIGLIIFKMQEHEVKVQLLQAEGVLRHDNEMQHVILDCVLFVLNDMMGKLEKCE